MNYIIKEQFDDFQVNEVLDESILSKHSTSILLYKLKKQNYTTERAVSHIARALNISRKQIAYAGAKDKQAITTQYITIKSASKERIDSLKLKDLELEFVGFAQEQLTLGRLLGNEFVIVLRGVKKQKNNYLKEFYIPNYFDNQRFSNNNFKIGLSILKGDYKLAVETLVKTDRDHKEAIVKHLETRLNDYVGALKVLPKKTLLFFVHSVQSRLFNELLSKKIINLRDFFEDEYSQGKLAFPKKLITKDELAEIPLVGWDSQEYNDILSKYNINSRNFLVRSIPELTLEETKRSALSKVGNFSINYGANDIAKVSFTLRKGSYATIVIRQIFANQQSC